MKQLIARLVHAGERIQVGPWNAMRAAVRSLRLIAGPNVRLLTTPNGTYVTFDGTFNFWNHPFKCSLTGETEAGFTPGTCGATPVTIDKVRLTGDADGVKPTLKLPKGLRLNGDGQGYFAVEVTCDPTTFAILTAEVVQVASLTSKDGKADLANPGASSSPYLGGIPSVEGSKGLIARQPVTLLQKYSTGEVVFWAVVHHNLQHRIRFDDQNLEAGRHFFWPE